MEAIAEFREYLNQSPLPWQAELIWAAAIVILAVAAWWITRSLLVRGLQALMRKTKMTWDDALVQAGVLHRLALLVPALILCRVTRLFLPADGLAQQPLNGIGLILFTAAAVFGVDAVLNAGHIVYRSFPQANQVPIKGFLQVVKIILYSIGLIIVLAIILNRSPLYLLSGLGAVTAVLMLIFKDAILGFVAGIQLTTNKMVSIGDWVSMPQYGADGYVIDIALTTVKVENWDKTVTTIPTYALISNSFQNWQAMFQSGGRRIKRSINLDMTSVRLCTEEMLERYRQIQHIKEYLARKEDEVKKYNAEHDVGDECRVNGRRLTNVGTFRAYVEAYLHNHPMINREMTLLVRQLQPGEHGLPIEIYAFCNDTAWAVYEGVQADIFDHILAVIPEFDLRVFQSPGGGDVQSLGDVLKTG